MASSGHAAVIQDLVALALVAIGLLLLLFLFVVGLRFNASGDEGDA